MSPNENEQPHDPEVVADAPHGVGTPDVHGPSLVARVASFAFVLALGSTALVLAALLVSERSALRRADADLFGALCDRSAAAIVDAIEGSDGGFDECATGHIEEELARLAQAKGVRGVALYVNDGEQVLTAQREEKGAQGGGATEAAPPRAAAAMPGPGRTLRDDHVIVARDFRAHRGGGIDLLLATWADYSTVDRRMRDLVALAGRAIGLTALFLVFLVPLAARWLFRTHARVAHDAADDRVPGLRDGAKGGAELLAIVQRIERDAGTIATFEREQIEAATQSLAQIERLERDLRGKAAACEEAQVVARSAAEAKAAFVANTSHEIRTPLHAVQGTSRLLLETDLDAEQRALAERSVRASTTLLELVEDVLDLARFDARSIEIEAAPFDPGALLEEVAELCGPLAAEKGIDISAFIQPNVPQWFVGDLARVRQALLRLADNAVKFTDEGEVALVLSWEAGPDGVAHVVFTVADSGHGIDDERRARLFQAFEQLDSSNTRRHGGVGLGLALVARIARAMGGEVRLDSTPGQGSTFRLALPLALEPNHEREIRAGRVVVPQPLHGCSVLVAQDTTRSGATLVANLERLGAQVTCEPSTYAGFEALLRGSFDVVMVDSALPGRDAFLGAVEANGDRGRVPLILMTPSHADRLPDDARDEAVSALVAKPLSRCELVRAIEAVTRVEEAPSASAQTNESPLDRAARDRVRILLVEDNLTNQQLVQYILGKRGYRVDVAANGRRAVDAFTVGEYSVILMDCQMPEMDGYEATYRIRELEQERGSRTPILAMTASVLERDRERCIEAGMDDLMAKPFQPAKMLEWLESWLVRSQYSAPGGEVAPRRTTHREALRDAEERTKVEPKTTLPPIEGALDLDVLGVLLEDQEGRILATELIESFLEVAPERLTALEEATARGDLTECAKIAHSLVSTSGTVGAVRLARLLREVERLAASGVGDESSRLIATMRGEFQSAVSALRRQHGG